MENGKVRMEFIGEQKGAVTRFVNGRPYRGADTPMHKYANAEPEDVKGLLAFGVWRVVRSQASAPAPLVAPPSSPMGFNWPEQDLLHRMEKQEAGMIQDAVNHIKNPPETFPGLDKAITTGFQEPNGQIAVSPAFQDDYSVREMTVSDVRAALERGVDKMTLLAWLEVERQSEKPRSGVVSAIEKSLQ